MKGKRPRRGRGREGEIMNDKETIQAHKVRREGKNVLLSVKEHDGPGNTVERESAI